MSAKNTPVERWKVSAGCNLPLLRTISLSQRFRLNGSIVSTVLHPVQFRQRENLWILTAGILDSMRYMNLTPQDADLHDEFDGNRRERAIWGSLSLMMWAKGWEEDVLEFRTRFKTPTQNFADTDKIKLALYNIILNSDLHKNHWNPVPLLESAVTDVMMEKEMGWTLYSMS